MKLRIASRASDLARWQAEHVAARLRSLRPGLEVTVRTFSTRGDREGGPLSHLGGQGLFTAEVDRALREGEAEIAVHSLKDLPIEQPADLLLAAVPERGPVADVLVSRDRRPLAELRRGARIGTSSPRRAAFVRSVRPDAEVVDVRGNLPRRLGKVESGELDATLLAKAGLVRLGFEAAITETLADLLPAPGQGALGVVVKRGSPALEIVAGIDHAPTRQAVDAERAVLAGLGGGCSLPLGVHAVPEDDGWRLRAVLYLDGGGALADDRRGPDPRRLAAEIAEGLRARGAVP
jgi:hydroxymethylbilane synthase